jgi:Protein of unknown function (DUF1761)
VNTTVFSFERVSPETSAFAVRPEVQQGSGIRHNYVAIGLLVVVYQVLGVMWYLPVTFGNLWLAGQGRTEIAAFGQALVYALVGALALNVCISIMVQKFGIATPAKAAQFAVLFTLGVCVQMLIVRYKFLSMPETVIAIDFMYTFVEILGSSLVLALWRKNKTVG